MIRYLLRKRYERQQETRREQLEQTIEDNGIDGDHPELENTIDYISKWSPPFVKRLSFLQLGIGLFLLLVFIIEGHGLLFFGFGAVVAASGGFAYWKYQDATSIEDDLTNDPQQFVR